VVNTGTGKRAKIAGYSVAGKTGTAQIAKNGRYGYGYVASFAGFVPARRPELAILVSVWRPRVGQYGGDVAAPVFREIARHTTTFLKIPPDAPGDLRDGADPASFYRRGAASQNTDD
jgi:cell division protein FtsI (penicillin-binding protein 3)